MSDKGKEEEDSRRHTARSGRTPLELEVLLASLASAQRNTMIHRPGWLRHFDVQRLEHISLNVKISAQAMHFLVDHGERDLPEKPRCVARLAQFIKGYIHQRRSVFTTDLEELLPEEKTALTRSQPYCSVYGLGTTFGLPEFDSQFQDHVTLTFSEPVRGDTLWAVAPTANVTVSLTGEDLGGHCGNARDLLSKVIASNVWPLSDQDASLRRTPLISLQALEVALREVESSLGLKVAAEVRSVFLPYTLSDPTESVVLKRGILLWGPPGTGKSYLAKYLFKQLGLRVLFARSASALNRRYVGETEAAIAQMFEKARQTPALLTGIFLDEVDALVPERGGRSGSQQSFKVDALSILLDLLGSADEYPNIFVIMATNRKDMIDTALLRPGRIDKAIFIGPVTPVQSLAHISGLVEPLGPQLTQKLLRLMVNFTRADLTQIKSQITMCARKSQVALCARGRIGPEELFQIFAEYFSENQGRFRFNNALLSPGADASTSDIGRYFEPLRSCISVGNGMLSKRYIMLNEQAKVTLHIDRFQPAAGSVKECFVQFSGWRDVELQLPSILGQIEFLGVGASHVHVIDACTFKNRPPDEHTSILKCEMEVLKELENLTVIILLDSFIRFVWTTSRQGVSTGANMTIGETRTVGSSSDKGHGVAVGQTSGTHPSSTVTVSAEDSEQISQEKSEMWSAATTSGKDQSIDQSIVNPDLFHALCEFLSTGEYTKHASVFIVTREPVLAEVMKPRIRWQGLLSPPLTDLVMKDPRKDPWLDVAALDRLAYQHPGLIRLSFVLGSDNVDISTSLARFKLLQEIEVVIIFGENFATECGHSCAARFNLEHVTVTDGVQITIITDVPGHSRKLGYTR